MAEKKCYWLKLKTDFFRQKEIKKLRSIAGGDIYTIIYLKMLLYSLETDGFLYYEGIDEDFSSELALALDESPDNVKIVIQFLTQSGLMVESDVDKYKLEKVGAMIGSESSSAERVRRMRERQKAKNIEAIEAKTNAERQAAYRAKKICEDNANIPSIGDRTNKDRYNGNYYVCFKRDNCECTICGSTKNLCMHHIDGYDPCKPQNSSKNKLITLCRKCHSMVHAGEKIPEKVLENIGYYDSSNESNDFCNVTVTDVLRNGNADIDIDIEKDIEKEKEKETKKKKSVTFVPPSVEEVREYCRSVGSRVDPEAFVAFYESKGWLVGNAKMKCWKAAIVTWEKRNHLERVKSTTTTTQKPNETTTRNIDLWND